MLRQFYLCKTPKQKIYLKPIIEGTKINFEIGRGDCNYRSGWYDKRMLTCPCCGAVTNEETLKEDAKLYGIKERLVAKISSNNFGKIYTLPEESDFEIVKEKFNIPFEPKQLLEAGNVRNISLPAWGLYSWSDLFSNRQLNVINIFIKHFEELNLNKNIPYNKAVITYLALFINRVMIANTAFGVYHTSRETLERPMGRQALPMMYVYPEANPFSGVSGSASNQLEWFNRYFENESFSQFWSDFNNASSGEKHQFPLKSISSVATDPPYYDAIAYADLSDAFYVWMKKTIGDIYPLSFATPLTPKSDECTALKHHHGKDTAKAHFEGKLLEIFKAIEAQTTGIVSIMFAHQSTEAWTTLCDSILGANMNIDASWTMDTEMQGALKTNLSYLESSVTVACTPSERKGYGSYKKVKRAIQDKVAEEVKTLYELGFRGADLLTACFGKAVSEFGNYEHVEKADGSEVSVAELLELARTAAFTALIRDFASDDYTKFYIGWLQLNGMGESDYDDATKFTRAGMSVNISDIFDHNLLVKNEGSNKQHLGTFRERAHEGLMIPGVETPLIDKVHHAMLYWANESTGLLHRLIAAYGEDINNEFWRVLHVLKELLPECDDRNQVMGLLNNAESLIKRSKTAITAQPEQGSLFDDDEL